MAYVGENFLFEGKIVVLCCFCSIKSGSSIFRSFFLVVLCLNKASRVQFIFLFNGFVSWLFKGFGVVFLPFLFKPGPGRMVKWLDLTCKEIRNTTKTLIANNSLESPLFDRWSSVCG